MANTTNFNWETPDDTDLVKDGAAAIRTLGSAIDTSLVDLKGGTTGQILSKATNTDMDFTWITNDVGDITAVSAGTGISGGGTSGAITITNDMATTITAAGDIVVGTGSGTYDNLPIGTTGQILTADTTVSPYKVKWATPAGGGSGLTLIDEIAISNSTIVNVDNVFTSTYKNYKILIVGQSTTTNPAEGTIKMRASSTDTSTNYASQRVYAFSTTIGTSSNAYGTDEWYGVNFSKSTQGENGSEITLYNPQLAKYTSYSSNTSYYNGNFFFSGGYLENTTQYDGFSLLFDNAINGTIFIYGFAKE